MTVRSTRFARRGATMAALASTALVLSACGPSVSDGDSEDPTDDGDADAQYADVEPADEVTFWTNHPGGSIDIAKAIRAAFTQETGIKVNHVTAGAHYAEVAQKFQAATVSC